MQKFLNRSDRHLWAIVSNGLRLRILRDNQALSRQSYIEFDLEAMFAGEVYSDLVLLWVVVHASRFVPREGERPETCWLEQWTREAEQQGARALGELRGGVERALRILGRGFTSHPRNAALRERLQTGALTPDGLHGQLLRVVGYRNLGAEELGGVYEGLLALTPQVSGDGADFTFAEFAGNARKTSGAYYTPDSLVQCLLDSALDPVVEAAQRGKSGADAERAILDLKVCDPAVGSGHFLVGAAHRLARHLARVRAHASGESEPSPLLYQHALRDVIGRCLYGVDMNPMAAELCRVSLWLEALEPGKPLSLPRLSHPGGEQPAGGYAGADRGGPARRGVQASAG